MLILIDLENFLVDNRLIGICVSTDDLDDRQTTFGRFSSDMITYCKEITIVRILPVQDATALLYSSIKQVKTYLINLSYA